MKNLQKDQLTIHELKNYCYLQESSDHYGEPEDDPEGDKDDIKALNEQIDIATETLRILATEKWMDDELVAYLKSRFSSERKSQLLDSWKKHQGFLDVETSSDYSLLKLLTELPLGTTRHIFLNAMVAERDGTIQIPGLEPYSDRAECITQQAILIWFNHITADN